MTDGGVDGKDTDGAGSDDGTDGEGGNPPQAAVVNATISGIPILVSFKFPARFLNQHNYVKCAAMRMGRVRSEMAYRPACGRLVLSAPERMSELTVADRRLGASSNVDKRKDGSAGLGRSWFWIEHASVDVYAGL